MRKKLLQPAHLPALSGFNSDLPEDMQRVFDELREQSDRGVALVGAAYVEELLERAIEHNLAIHSKEHRKSLFDGPNSVMGTFSAKIALAYALNIVSARIHEDLQIMRKIRNDFAHSFEQLAFRTAPVSERVEALQLPLFVNSPFARKEDEHRQKFMDAIRVLTALLLSEAAAATSAAQPPSPARS